MSIFMIEWKTVTTVPTSTRGTSDSANQPQFLRTAKSKVPVTSTKRVCYRCRLFLRAGRVSATAGDVGGLGFPFAIGAAVTAAGLGLTLATRMCTFLLVHKRLRPVGWRR